MEMQDTRLCRLCFSEENCHIHIFKDSASGFNIAEVIEKHFQCEVSETDFFPNSICNDCWTKTECFHKFHQFVKSAQDNFSKKFLAYCVKEEPSTIDASNVDTEFRYTDEGGFNLEAEPMISLSEEKNNIMVYSDVLPSINVNDSASHFKIKDENEEVVPSPLQLCDIMYDSNSKENKDVLRLPIIGDVSSSKKRQVMGEHFDMTCDHCDISFKSLEQAQSHYERKHNISNGYIKCCQRKLNKRTVVKDHIQWHLNPDIFRCSICGQDMKFRKALYAHHYHHKTSASPKYKCDICKKCFSTKGHVRSHIVGVHVATFDTPYVCEICDKGFRSEKYLAVHVQLTHNAHNSEGETNIETLVSKTATPLERDRFMSEYFDMSCDVCKVNLESLKKAKSHYLTEHKIRFGYIKCCNLKFKHPWEVQDHIDWHSNPKMFKCKMCEKVLKSKQTLKIHISTHKALENKNYECRVCYKSFGRIDGLKSHIVRVHPDFENELKCDVCGERFAQSEDLKNHKQNTHADETNDKKRRKCEDVQIPIPEYFDMTCDICHDYLESWEQSKLHYLHEHSIDRGYIKCCCLKFRKWSEVQDHISWHSNPDIFKCDMCHKVCKTKIQLRDHLLTHKSKHVCKVCGKYLQSNSKLKAHQIIHEKNDPQFECKDCKKRFPSAKYLKSHVNRIHTPNDHQICEICAKVCKSKPLLRAHLLTHSEPPPRLKEKVQCDICGAWLMNRYKLKTHMLIHTSGPQKCDQCDKVAQGQNALLSHIRTVHIDANFKCHLCDKSFKLATALKDHVATHTGEKQYKCAYCPEGFIWRSNCYSHQKKAHPREWSDDQLKKTKAKSQPKIIE